ncbi:MAG: hypothetical protein ACI4J5_09460, partial [Oscillospiraceae bacterium]
MYRKKKTVPYALLTAVTFLMNLISIPLNELALYTVGRISEAVNNDFMLKAEFYSIGAAYIVGLCPFGTIAAALLGGLLPGMTTAVLTEIAMILIYDSNNSIFLLIINVVLALLCSLIRSKMLLSGKDRTAAAALIIGAVFIIRFLFYDFITQDLTVIIPFFLILCIELLICRCLLPKFEKFFPLRSEKSEKNYRSHSIKRVLLLLVNITAVGMSVFFIVISTQKYYDDIRSKTIGYIRYLDDIVYAECGDEIEALEFADGLAEFDDTALTEIVSRSAQDVQISKIVIFGAVNVESGELQDYKGTIEYEYSEDYSGYIVSDKRVINERYSAGELWENVQYYGNYGNISLAYIAGNADLSGIIGYAASMVIIAVSMIILINAFTVYIMDKRIVDPINSMTSAAAAFAYDTDEHRAEAMESFKLLDIRSG